MAFQIKNWFNKGNTTKTPLNAAGLNDLENRINKAFSEMNGEKISDPIKLEEGIELLSHDFHKIGKFVVGNLVVQKNDKFSVNKQIKIGNLNFACTTEINGFCAFADTQWEVQDIGYFFMFNGEIVVKSKSTYPICKIILYAIEK